MLLEGKKAVVLNVANKRSIAWAIAQAMTREGAALVLGCQNDRMEEKVRPLAAELTPPAGVEPPILLQCDVATDEYIDRFFSAVGGKFGDFDILVHSLAYAPVEALEAPFINTSREAFRTALDISAYSLVGLARAAGPLMRDGGSILALSYYGAEKVVPNYNIMGVAKAALEASVRYLAYDLGPRGIRVNAISSGPLNTLAARGVSGFTDVLKVQRERAPLKRNLEHREVADAAVFLCSDLASGITGEVTYVDCGYNIMGF